MILKFGNHQITFPRPALVMGIVNVTPDSFSDGGKYLHVESAVAHARLLEDQGADILDIGGESTKPGSSRIAEEEELKRVIPVIELLAKSVKIPISIDTMKPAVARAALQAGASIVNDVGANRDEDPMWRIVADAGAGYVVVHMQGTPETMQDSPDYTDVVQDVHHFFRERLDRLRIAGISPDQVMLDVGIGFGKTLENNLTLLAALANFNDLGRPLLLGVSRKSFIGRASGCEEEERLPGGLACTVKAALDGVGIFRTHDVAETRQALRMVEAIKAMEK
jgi:dihydropteroate synthase